ncbi:2,3-dehydroadipyl-CoA hydratase [Crateriforma conspicua]|uniref:Enoyl-CoA hydratase domain-containing protein 3, mitochondrial n=1 Tax=Crateriforma conspicua TaxID=2527996 RepID=A0A5C6FS18_9PLAN|nr:enoyl-CoA hydratase [Crateriforma conspicua]TWU65024.1 2,3-dehydroadipyl-CoA hydratase [Crateriforma conspicua]
MNPSISPEVSVRITDSIAHVTLDRAHKRNALSLQVLADLERALSELGGDTSVRVVIIAASGKVFSSGHDLKEMVNRSAEDYEKLFRQCTMTMQRIRQIPQPVIAQVQGLATAAGCQLAASCDLIVAGRSAAFATPGVKIGLFCTTPMVPLVRGLPPKLAMEMLLTGRPITAQRAYDVGFVNAVCDDDVLPETTIGLSQNIVESSGHAATIGKAAFYRQLHLSEPDAYADAVDVMTRNACDPEADEGIRAFLEKRPPRWDQPSES